MEDPAPSNPQATKDVDMDQADYDRESDPTQRKKRKEQFSGELHQPKQKALTPKVKASPQSAIDEETESDNYLDNRAPLLRRPTMKSPPPSLDQSR